MLKKNLQKKDNLFFFESYAFLDINPLSEGHAVSSFLMKNLLNFIKLLLYLARNSQM
jgi:hypothetical protein